MRKFIVIFGQKQNGKSTFAKMLQVAFYDQMKLHLPIDGFAYPIKEWLAEWFNITNFDKVKEQATCEQLTVPARYAACEIAKLARSLNPDVFIDMLVRRHLQDDLCPYIVEDGRFENEALKCKAMGSYNIFVCKPDKLVRPYEALKTGRENVVTLDESERYCGMVASHLLHAGTDPSCKDYINNQAFDQYIINNDTKEKLNETAQQLVYKLRNTYLNPKWDGK